MTLPLTPLMRTILNTVYGVEVDLGDDKVGNTQVQAVQIPDSKSEKVVDANPPNPIRNSQGNHNKEAEDKYVWQDLGPAKCQSHGNSAEG